MRVKAKKSYNIHNIYEQRSLHEETIVDEMKRRIALMKSHPLEVDLNVMKAPITVCYKVYYHYTKSGQPKQGTHEDAEESFKNCLRLLSDKRKEEFYFLLNRAAMLQHSKKITDDIQQKWTTYLTRLADDAPRVLETTGIMDKLSRLKADHEKMFERVVRDYATDKKPYEDDTWRTNALQKFEEANTRAFLAKLEAILNYGGNAHAKILGLKKLLKEHWEKTKNSSFSLLATCEEGGLQSQVKAILCSIATELSKATGEAALDLLMPGVDESTKALLQSEITPLTEQKLLTAINAHSKKTLLSFETLQALEAMELARIERDITEYTAIINLVQVKDMERMLDKWNLLPKFSSHHTILKFLEHLDTEHFHHFIESSSRLDVPRDTSFLRFVRLLNDLSEDKAAFILTTNEAWFDNGKTLKENFEFLGEDLEKKLSLNYKGVGRYAAHFASRLHEVKDISAQDFLWLLKKIDNSNPKAIENIFANQKNVDIIFSSPHLEDFLPYLQGAPLIQVTNILKERQPELFTSARGKELFIQCVDSIYYRSILPSLCPLISREITEALLNDAKLFQQFKNKKDTKIELVLEHLNSPYIKALLYPTPANLILLGEELRRIQPGSNDRRPEGIVTRFYENAIAQRNIGCLVEMLYELPDFKLISSLPDPNNLKRAILTYVNSNETLLERFRTKMKAEPSQIREFFATERYTKSQVVSKRKEDSLCEEALQLAGIPASSRIIFQQRYRVHDEHVRKEGVVRRTGYARLSDEESTTEKTPTGIRQRYTEAMSGRKGKTNEGPEGDQRPLLGKN